MFKTYRVIVVTFCIQVKREVRKRSRGIGDENLALCPLCFLVLVPADDLMVPSSENPFVLFNVGCETGACVLFFDKSS